MDIRAAEAITFSFVGVLALVSSLLERRLLRYFNRAAVGPFTNELLRVLKGLPTSTSFLRVVMFPKNVRT
jgi:hypothetical protein